MTTAAASLLIKALIVTTGYVPTYSKAVGERIVRVELTGGRSVVITGNEKGYDMGEATEAEIAAAKPIAKHYKAFLRGGELPSAPAGITTKHLLETEHEGGGLEVFELVETKETKRVAALRDILKQGQCKVVEGKLVDTFSASAFIQVYDMVNEANKTKLLSFSLAGAIGACFKLINNQRNK
ncbi:hypothetical protein [Hymenobacter sp. YC55]|uniref:hypothetical protein n=1 Tax=Hymenobacter sp. YC55 TaxID=3034019 RepID=UPI0023F6B651|nr:hypothetical protein [Hymenobacter sp. YC55]MDF7815349.1 hypothetical protein [Hymenobacter sp. YC55]